MPHLAAARGYEARLGNATAPRQSVRQRLSATYGARPSVPIATPRRERSTVGTASMYGQAATTHTVAPEPASAEMGLE